MVKNFRIAKWATVLGLLIAALGIITPIVWDLWRRQARIELRQLEEAVIIQKQDDLRNLKILYADKELENLTRLRFVLSNTGATPIVADDLIKPPTITFKSATKILDTKIEAVYPRDLDANVKQVDNDSCVQLEFPLLNPGDNITFSILIADYSGTSFDASARIVGVEELSIVRKVNEPKKAERRTDWSVFIVGVFSAFCILLVVTGVHKIRPEMTFKRTLKEGKSIIPPNTRKELLSNLVRSTLSWTTSNERRPPLQYLECLSSETVSEEERQRIELLVKSVAQGAMSNVTMVIVFALLAVIGAAYVVYQVF